MNCNMQQSDSSPFNAKIDLKRLENDFLIHKDPNVYRLALINRLNEEFAYIRRNPPIILVIERQIKQLVHHSHSSFMNVFGVHKVLDFDCDLDSKKKNTYISCTTLWLNSDHRKEYVEIGFSPKSQPGILNSYIHGFLPKTEPGEIGPLLEHLDVIWARKSIVKFDYLIKWLAFGVQKPFEKQGVALSPISQQGAGKGILTDKLSSHYGHFYRSVRESDVLGNFNSAVVGVFFLHFDEAVFNSSPEARANMKRLITERQLQVTYKGSDSVSVESTCSVIISSNNTRVCDAEAKSRRYYPIYLDNRYAGPGTPMSTEYMQKVIDVKPAHFIYFLEHVDISNFNPREFEITEDLMDQMILSLTALQSFWLLLLENPPDNESIISKSYNINTEELKAIARLRIKENDPLPNEELYNYYKQYNKHLSTRYKKMNELSYMQFLKECHSLIPSITSYRKNIKKDSVISKAGHLLIKSIPEARKEWIKSVGFNPFENM